MIVASSGRLNGINVTLGQMRGSLASLGSDPSAAAIDLITAQRLAWRADDAAATNSNSSVAAGALVNPQPAGFTFESTPQERPNNKVLIIGAVVGVLAFAGVAYMVAR
jgi:hypothetical protein